VICAGDSVQNRVAYSFERDEDRQPFREIVGTVSTCLHLILHEQFIDDSLSAYFDGEECATRDGGGDGRNASVLYRGSSIRI
jgi:hypothetical protein